jgi:hypothetical protein
MKDEKPDHSDRDDRQRQCNRIDSAQLLLDEPLRIVQQVGSHKRGCDRSAIRNGKERLLASDVTPVHRD